MVALYVTLALVGLRIARRNVDPFIKLVAATSTAWLVGQAAINIFYVIGLLPVTGLTLPMISAGGTSLVVTMAIFGLLAEAGAPPPILGFGISTPAHVAQALASGAKGVIAGSALVKLGNDPAALRQLVSAMKGATGLSQPEREQHGHFA